MDVIPTVGRKPEAEESQEKEMSMEKICGICGQKFTSHHNLCRYCSDPCREAARKQAQALQRKKRYREKRQQPKTCAWCGQVFVDARRTAVYCGPTCLALAQGEQNRKCYALKRGKAYTPPNAERRRALLYANFLGTIPADPMDCPWHTGQIKGTALGCDPVLGF